MLVNFVNIGEDPFSFDYEIDVPPRRKDLVKYYGNAYAITKRMLILQQEKPAFYRIWIKRIDDA